MAKRHPNDPFLGSRHVTGRDENGNNVFGEYEWKSYGETETLAKNLARGLKAQGVLRES